MSTDTREALAALAEIEGWFEKREAIAGDLGALDEQLEMAGLAGRVAGIRAALATQPARPNIGDRLKLHSGSGKCKVCKTDNCMLTGLGTKPSIWNCLKEDEC